MKTEYKEWKAKSDRKIFLGLAAAVVAVITFVLLLVPAIGVWAYIVGLVIVGYPTIYQNSSLKVKTLKWGSGAPKVRIVQISDFHCNSLVLPALQAKLVAMQLSSSDLIVLTGDTFDGDRKSQRLAEELMEFLSKLPCKCLVIWGNHEVEYPETLAQAKMSAEKADIRQLNKLSCGANGVTIVGLDYDDSFSRFDIEALKSLSRPVVLVTHTRDQAEVAAATGVFDVVLCGHEHGGQIRLPLLGAIFGPGTTVLFPDLKGKPTKGMVGERIYVCSGAGYSLFPLRTLNRVQITVHEIGEL